MNPNCVELEKRVDGNGIAYYGLPDQAICKHCGQIFENAKAYVMRANSACTKCGRRYNSSDSEAMCGCGRHMVNVSDGKIVWYNNNWWSIRCLCFKVDQRLPRFIAKIAILETALENHKKMRLKFIRMKSHMKKLPCSNCGHPVGNRFVQKKDGLLCGTCGVHFEGDMP